jgi:hypothetical protein
MHVVVNPFVIIFVFYYFVTVFLGSAIIVVVWFQWTTKSSSRVSLFTVGGTTILTYS